MVVEDAHWRIGGLDENRFASGREVKDRALPGVGVEEAAGGLFQNAHKGSGKHAGRGIIVEQIFVQALHHLLRGFEGHVAHRRVSYSARHGHQQRSRNPFAGYVAEQENQRMSRRTRNVKEVAAYL